MPVAKYRKKPVVISAIQWIGGRNTDEVAAWIREGGGNVLVGGVDGQSRRILMIRTLEGPLNVSVGDFVIKGVMGEFYPCRSDIFEATYETL